jgi:hypothetical protein
LFDLSLLTFPISAPGKPHYPGFLVMVPPKKPARGRETDILILYFKLYGKSTITDAGLKTWLETKASTYHRSSGTVTSGMRAVFDDINNDLLDRNSRFAGENGQVNGSLKLMVLKKETVYMAVCGPGAGFLVTAKGAEHIIDDENGGRGLGIAQAVNVRFSQANVSKGDFVLFANEPSQTWTSDVMTSTQPLANDALHRHLFGGGTGEAQGVLVRFREGTGKISLLKPRPVAPGEEAQRPAVDSTQKPDGTAIPPKTPPFTEGPRPQSSERPTPTRSTNTLSTQSPQPIPSARLPEATGQKPVREAQPAVNNPLPSTSEVKAAVGGALRKGAEVKGKTESWVKNAAQKVLPGDAGQPVKFPKILLIFIAVAVPIIIVAVAATLYARNGRDTLFDGYLAQAQQLAVRADGQMEDKAARLASLQESLYWLDKADAYGETEESIALRQQVQTELDDMQDITRINMVSAIHTALPNNTVITQLAISGTDLYALDSTTGTVTRFFLTGSEYQQDTAFDCGPSPESTTSAIGKLVDMVPISTNNKYGASLLAIDSQGKLEYCVSGESGYIVSLAQPDMGWVEVSDITLNEGNLYVLDVRGNAVYRLEGSGNEFPDEPILFFDDYIPSLTAAIDIEVIGYELYILRSNGELAECTYSALKDMKSTECDDPAPYNDNRTGEVVKVSALAGTNFTQMHMTQAPDSSLYFLDSSSKAIYHLSYARNLQDILYPRLTDGENIDRYSPTAFTVSSTRQVFMAFGSLIYYGQLP